VSRWMKPWEGFVASLGSWGFSSLNMSLSDSSRLARADSPEACGIGGTEDPL
jgi:hypothetical protein